MTLFTEAGATVPLVLVVEREGAGAVTGLSPTVALRDASGRYLDWADGTFKLSAWTTRKKVLVEQIAGNYFAALDVSANHLTPGDTYRAEYLTEDPSLPGLACDLITVARDTDFLRKMATNRMEQVSGSPGQLTLFDDNGTTPLHTWTVRDEYGGGIAGQVGVPARRSAAT